MGFDRFSAPLCALLNFMIIRSALVSRGRRDTATVTPVFFRSGLFSDVTQCRVVIPYRHFRAGTTVDHVNEY